LLGTIAMCIHFVRGRLSKELPQVELETVPDHVSVGAEAHVNNSSNRTASAEDIALITVGSANPPGFTSAISPTSSPVREVLSRRVFNLLDAAGNGALECMEMRLFAEFMGFGGSDAEWAQEWVEMCNYLGCDPVIGVDFGRFCRLVNDSSSQGCFCSNADLRAFRDDGAQSRQPGTNALTNSSLSMPSLASVHRSGGSSGGSSGSSAPANSAARADLGRGSSPDSSSFAVGVGQFAGPTSGSSTCGFSSSMLPFDGSNTHGVGLRSASTSPPPSADRTPRNRLPLETLPPRHAAAGVVGPVPGCHETAANFASAAGTEIFGDGASEVGDDCDYRI